MPVPEKLSEEAIASSLKDVPEWSETGEQLQRTFQFDDFKAAMGFVQRIADYAEQQQHHPDILIRYNKVTITVSTHDAGGITTNDFALAKAADGMLISA